MSATQNSGATSVGTASAEIHQANPETNDRMLTEGDAAQSNKRYRKLFNLTPVTAYSCATERKRLESELSVAVAAADKANRAKSEFLSNMSHELRTPLNAILGFAQLVESGSPAPTPLQQRSIKRILKSGWYLLELINEILELAFVESGKLTLSQESVSLNELLLECQVMVEPQAQARGIRMTFPRFETPCFINADRIRVKQILLNLLSNAVKYSKPNGVISVDVERCPADSIRISVRDSGDGLTPDQLAKLFQPFNRFGGENGAEGGAGIGLVVSRRLVELMGGAIGADSVAGTGSVFWFELSSSAAPQPALPEAVAAWARPKVRDGVTRRTLLYVEDNPGNLEFMVELIARRPDLRLITATTGTRGIEYARASLPQAILMDINMPGISGIDAMRILRADPLTKHIPIVALSANAIPRDIEKGLQAGFFRYITKPIRIETFTDALDATLAYAQSAPGHVANESA
ncbi:MAG: ATP-binding protein [Betaproteobacteria bacterium]